MRPAVLAVSATLCLAAALATPVDVRPSATAAEKTEAGVDPVHPDEISFLRSRFKEEVGLDVQDEDLHHLLEGAARFAVSADALEVPPYPVDAIKAQADVDDEPVDYRSD